MELGDLVVVNKSGHPFNGLSGKIVGRRGNYTPDDPIFLVFIKNRARSFLIPQSMLRLMDPSEIAGTKNIGNWPF